MCKAPRELPAWQLSSVRDEYLSHMPFRCTGQEPGPIFGKTSLFCTKAKSMVFCSFSILLLFFLLDNIIKRIFNILKFTWVLFLATVDSFTTWLNSISREHIDISTVLRIERCMLTREIKKVILLVQFFLLLPTLRKH